MSIKEDLFINTWKVKDPKGYKDYLSLVSDLKSSIDIADQKLDSMAEHIEADVTYYSRNSKDIMLAELAFKKQLNIERRANIDKRISTIAKAVISERNFRYGAGELFSGGLIGDQKVITEFYYGLLDKMHNTLSKMYFGEVI